MVMYLFSFNKLKLIWNKLVNIIIVNVIIILLFGLVVVKLVIIAVIIIVIGLVGLEIRVGVFLNSVVNKFINIELYKLVVGFVFEVILKVSVIGRVIMVVVRLLKMFFLMFLKCILLKICVVIVLFY